MSSQATKTTQVTSEGVKNPTCEGYQSQTVWFPKSIDSLGRRRKAWKKIHSAQWEKIGDTSNYEVSERIKCISP